MTTTWRGSVYARGRKLWVSFKQHGEWRDKPTPFYIGQEAQARALLDQMRRQLAAGEEIADDGAPITVRRYGKLWLQEGRRPQDDDSHLRIHIFPALGDMSLAEVRPRHVKALLDTMAVKGRAPRTRRNVYSTLRSLFHAAQMKDLIVASPCILTDADYGTVEDGERFDREKAVFTREEVASLISDERVPQDRRVMYALLFLAALRHGEAASLRWRRVEFEHLPPLGRIVVATSNHRKGTKTGGFREMPIHPLLAAILGEWKLGGWARMFGRDPAPDDLVLPTPPPTRGKGRRTPGGGMRARGYSWKRLGDDLETLGLRHRRVHDTRRTFISLARGDGASKEILRLATHKAKEDVMDSYTSIEWAPICEAVARLRIERPSSSRMIALPASVLH